MLDNDFDADGDIDFDADHDVDLDGEFSLDGDAGVGFVDLLSIRALFLFAAFFGLTGVTLGLVGSAEPLISAPSTADGVRLDARGTGKRRRAAKTARSSGQKTLPGI